jgi:hypothetical protein
MNGQKEVTQNCESVGDGYFIAGFLTALAFSILSWRVRIYGTTWEDIVKGLENFRHP